MPNIITIAEADFNAAYNAYEAARAGFYADEVALKSASAMVMMFGISVSPLLR